MSVVDRNGLVLGRRSFCRKCDQISLQNLQGFPDFEAEIPHELLSRAPDVPAPAWPGLVSPRTYCVPRILIADDNTSVRIALKQLLSGLQDCEFLEAENGQAAISQALSCQPDVVILDLAMPVLDGLSAARKIRSVYPELPVFLLTMHCSAFLEAEAKALGLQGVISKARSAILIGAVQALLRTGRPPSATALPAEPALAIQAEGEPGRDASSPGAAQESNSAQPLRRVG